MGAGESMGDADRTIVLYFQDWSGSESNLHNPLEKVAGGVHCPWAGLSRLRAMA